MDSARFRELLAGRADADGRSSRTATRQDANSRIGIDLTFSAPKSVSLQALVGGDARIVEAHDRAVSRAIAAAEERAQARKKVRGWSQVEDTRNLVVAKFRHETSRERDPTRAPVGKESNWVPTSSDGGFEVLFRFYGPERPLFEKTWRLPDIEKV